MINLLIGPPGGGKSYEATVCHVLPALEKGRKVITNLPLDLERIAQIDAGYPGLIQIVENRKGTIRRAATRFSPAAEEEGIIRAFATMDDYADPWRHPDNGSGPFYVIDECHLAMPRGGTAIDVEEWYSLHRHESADVLLITQSYGKVSKTVVDLVQVCYRVKKATAFGSAKKYIRKVQDGVRGEVVNTSIRQYEKRYFGLYKSHTRGGGSELAAQDITPFWKRWPFIGLALCVFILFGMLASGRSLNPLQSSKVQAKEQPSKPIGPAPVKVVEETIVDGKVVSSSVPVATASQPVQQPVEGKGTPFEGHKIHVIGSVRRGDAYHVLFSVSTSDRFKMEIDNHDLKTIGYTVEVKAPCAIKLTYEDWTGWAICDTPIQEQLAGGGPDLPQRQNVTPGVSRNNESAGISGAV